MSEDVKADYLESYSQTIATATTSIWEEKDAMFKKGTCQTTGTLPSEFGTMMAYKYKSTGTDPPVATQVKAEKKTLEDMDGTTAAAAFKQNFKNVIADLQAQTPLRGGTSFTNDKLLTGTLPKDPISGTAPNNAFLANIEGKVDNITWTGSTVNPPAITATSGSVARYALGALSAASALLLM
jgi:hypothetical protein